MRECLLGFLQMISSRYACNWLFNEQTCVGIPWRTFVCPSGSRCRDGSWRPPPSTRIQTTRSQLPLFQRQRQYRGTCWMQAAGRFTQVWTLKPGPMSIILPPKQGWKWCLWTLFLTCHQRSGRGFSRLWVGPLFTTHQKKPPTTPLGGGVTGNEILGRCGHNLGMQKILPRFFVPITGKKFCW